MSERQEAETTVITALVQDPRKLVELQSITKDHFSDKSARVVYLAAKRYNERHALKGRTQYAPFAALERELDRMLAANTDNPKRNKARKHALRAARNLLDEVVNAEAVTEHEFRDAVTVMMEGWLDEQTRGLLLELADHLEQGTEGIYQKLQEATARIAPASTGVQIERLDIHARKVLIDYERAKSDKRGTKIEAFDPTLNKVTSGGGKKGRLWLVAAYTKGGKTILSMQQIYHAAKIGFNCAIVTSEQTNGDVRLMMACRHSHNFKPGGLQYNAIEEGRLTPADEAVLRRTVNDLDNNRFMGKVSYFKVPHGTSIGEVRALLESVHARISLDVVMIDHTGLFSPSKKRDSQAANAAAVMMEIKDLALNFGRDGLWVLACHQISRDGFENAQKRGGYYLGSDLANTAEAERSCDLMLYAYRDEELKDMSEIRIGVALDRYGPGEVKGWNLFEHFQSSAILPIANGP